MKLKTKILTLATIVASLAGCEDGGVFPSKIINVEEGVMLFSPQLNLLSDDFDGLGVEWGAYEDTNKLQTNYWDRVTKYADRMDGMSLVRCMVSYDWFCENFDNKGDNDKTNDTWTYNFTNKYMKSAEDILSYCQAHNVDVAFGAWNVIGTFPKEDDVWNMMDDVTSDPRWAKITADVLEYLILRKGYTCIKYFVSSNEPNYTGKPESSKNGLNTFAKWRQGVLNVRTALDNIGLTNVKIIGSDATYINNDVFDSYLFGIAGDTDLKNAVGDYGIHVYTYTDYLENGQLLKTYKQYATQIKDIDNGFNVDRRFHIWEAGLSDYKNSADCNTINGTYIYAQNMINYTLTAFAGGVNGITYWDFDDAMHFMYNSDGTVTAKEWGMFSTLSSATQEKQQLRPWYQSSMLLTNLFRRHNIVFDNGENDNHVETQIKAVATISNDKKLAGVVFTNENGVENKKVKFVIDEKYEDDEKLYVYIINQNRTLIGEDGFIIPNYVFNGTMNKITELTVPGGSSIFVTNKEL